MYCRLSFNALDLTCHELIYMYVIELSALAFVLCFTVSVKQ